MEQELLRSRLLALARCAVWGTPAGFSFSEDFRLKDILSLTREQGVLGWVVDAVESMGVAARLTAREKLELMRVQKAIISANLFLDGKVAKIFAVYHEMGIRPMLMKGQAIAREYRNPETRQCGDIDLCFRSPEDVAKAFSWGHRQSGGGESYNEKHQEVRWEGVMVENHQYMVSRQYPPYQRALQAVIARLLREEPPRHVSVGGAEIETLPPTLCALVLVVHLSAHLMGLGVGLRQFFDVAVFFRNHADEIDGAALRSAVDSAGLRKASREISYVLNKHMGLPREKIPFECSSGKYAERIMRKVWENGNMGHKVSRRFAKAPGWVREGVSFFTYWREYWSLRKIFPKEAVYSMLQVYGKGFKDFFCGESAQRGSASK